MVRRRESRQVGGSSRSVPGNDHLAHGEHHGEHRAHRGHRQGHQHRRRAPVPGHWAASAGSGAPAPSPGASTVSSADAAASAVSVRASVPGPGVGGVHPYPPQIACTPQSDPGARRGGRTGGGHRHGPWLGPGGRSRPRPGRVHALDLRGSRCQGPDQGEREHHQRRHRDSRLRRHGPPVSPRRTGPHRVRTAHRAPSRSATPRRPRQSRS